MFFLGNINFQIEYIFVYLKSINLGDALIWILWNSLYERQRGEKYRNIYIF